VTAVPVPDWFSASLDSLLLGDVDRFIEIYADDAVHEVSLAPPGRPTCLAGKVAISDYMRILPSVARFDSFDDITARQAGDELIIEAKAHGRRPNGEPFHLQYIWFIKQIDGQVIHLRDYTVPLDHYRPPRD
jgi:ketosteroid isomerase-like protein